HIHHATFCLFLSVLFFFFSSRRRHTRFSRDWSSDVCSSDLIELLALLRAATGEAVTGFELMTRIGMESAVRHIEGVADPFDKPYGFYVLIECTSAHAPGPLRAAVEGALEGALERGLVLDAVFADSRAQARALWYIRE